MVEPVPVEVIVEAARRDPSRTVRWRAGETLTLHREWGEATLEALQIVARSDPDETVRAMAAAFVERLGRGHE
jgi:hypothetical protein